MNSKKSLREVKLLEYYARTLWPVHRLLAKKHLTPRCNKCALSAKASPLKDGLCDSCSNPSAKTLHSISAEELHDLEKSFSDYLHQHEGVGLEYDALILISGGKDSTYLVNRLQTDFPKLRILTAVVDNGFMSPVAYENIDRLVQKLEVAHIRVQPHPRFYKQAFSYAITHVGDIGCAQTVDKVDGELFLDIAKHLAARLQIPLLIGGFSLEQIDRYLHWNSFKNEDYDSMPRSEVGPFALTDLLSEADQSFWWNPNQYQPEHVPHLVCPFYVWRLHESEVQRAVERLQIFEKGKTSPLVTNHTLIPLCALVDIAKLGYLSWEPEFCRMIREGKADYQLWRNIFEITEYSQKTGHFISESVDDALAALSLQRSDVGLKK